MSVVQVITYASLLIAVLAMLAKALRYLRAPQHFRWELYPVPHERGRAEYGGSYLEELDWWTKKRHSDKLRELREMMAEIIFLKGVFHHNVRVWTFSFPFHLGLYLVIAWLLLLLGGSVLELAGVPVGQNAALPGAVVHYLTFFTGYIGLVLAGLGALGLFFWRASSKGQRAYNSPAEYFNLLFFVVVVAVTLISQVTLDQGFVGLRTYVGGLATFSKVVIASPLFVAEIVLISLLIMYIPLSRMSHFVAKYFLYHSVRWNDKPNVRGSALEKQLMKLLEQNVGWAGPHIQTGESWKAVVTKESHHEQ
jgi:nitrate reductase gamma subunit